MFGVFRRRPGLQTGHRSRARYAGWLALGVVLAIVIGEVAADVVNSGGPAALVAARTYTAAVVPLVDESNSLTSWMTDVRHDTLKLGRLGIATALGHLVGGCTNVQQQLAELGVPAPNTRAGALVVDTFADRTRAARDITGAVELATGPSRDAKGAEQRFAQAWAAIGDSDASYGKFVASLSKSVRKGIAVPSSKWASAISWDSTASSAFATLLAGTPSLQVQHDLVIVAVSVAPPALRITGLPTTTTSTTTTTSSTSTTTTTSTTIPGATTTSTLVPTTSSTTTTTTSTTTTTTTLQIPPPGSVSHLGPTSSIFVSVVVANAGDVDASKIGLAATLTAIRVPPGPGRPSASTTSSTSTTSTTLPPLPPPEATHLTIASLAAGASVEVHFAKLRVEDGRYQLVVTLGKVSESVTLQVGVG